MNIDSAARIIVTLGLFASGLITLATAVCMACREPHGLIRPWELYNRP